MTESTTAPRTLPRIPAYALPRAEELPPARGPWQLAAQRAALLVHDMQQYFLAAFGDAPEPIPAVIANIRRLLDAAHAQGVPVFYTAQHGNQDRRDRGLQADLWGPGMRAVPEHEQITPQLAPQPGDIVLTKHRYSAFQRSNLAELMRARGRDQIVICGVYAHIGCLATAVDAFQRDVEPFFVADALADYSRDKHDAAVQWVAATCGVPLMTQQVMRDMTQSNSLEKT